MKWNMNEMEYEFGKNKALDVIAFMFVLMVIFPIVMALAGIAYILQAIGVLDATEDLEKEGE